MHHCTIVPLPLPGGADACHRGDRGSVPGRDVAVVAGGMVVCVDTVEHCGGATVGVQGTVVCFVGSVLVVLLCCVDGFGGFVVFWWFW